jgi:hypothetical protein
LTDNSTGLPPKTNSETWSLRDGGRWKTTYKYPVYAIPSVAGQAIMAHLADYSGNLTDVPNGDVIVRDLPASDYVRLGAELGIRKYFIFEHKSWELTAAQAAQISSLAFGSSS